MLQQTEKIFDSFVKRGGAVVVSRERQEDIIKRAKRVRAVDYVLEFDCINGVSTSKSVTTRANWFFILTGAACLWHNDVSKFPRVSVNFENYPVKSPFNSEVEFSGSVPSNLVFGREALNGKDAHYEEYKDFCYVLDQRFVISLDVFPQSSENFRGNVILTGIEVDLSEA
jgi:hypothetical protein